MNTYMYKHWEILFPNIQVDSVNGAGSSSALLHDIINVCVRRPLMAANLISVHWNQISLAPVVLFFRAQIMVFALLCLWKQCIAKNMLMMELSKFLIFPILLKQLPLF